MLVGNIYGRYLLGPQKKVLSENEVYVLKAVQISIDDLFNVLLLKETKEECLLNETIRGSLCKV